MRDFLSLQRRRLWVSGWTATDYAFVLLLGGAMLANVWPIWSVQHLPLHDFGGHVQLFDAIGRLHSSATTYSDIYMVDGWLNPNSLTHKLAIGLVPVVGATNTAKLFLSWYLVATPISLMLLAKALRRSRWLVFFATATLYHGFVRMGFVDFLVSIPLLWFSVVLTTAEYSRRRVVGLAALVTALYFAHAITFLWGFGACLFIIVSRKQGRRMGFGLLPAALLCSLWVLRKVVWNESTSSGEAYGGTAGLGAYYKPFWLRIVDLKWETYGFFTGAGDEILAVAVVLAWILLMAGPGGARIRVFGDALIELLTLSAILGYFVLPNSFRAVEIIGQRLALFAIQLLPLWRRGRMNPFGGGAVGVMVAASFAYPVYVRSQFETYDRGVRAVCVAVEALPQDSRLLLARWSQHAGVVESQPNWHLAKGVHAESNAGYTNDSFAARASSAISYRRGKSPPELDRSRFWEDPRLGWYDFILLESDQPPTVAISHGLEVRERIGPWWVLVVNHR